MSFHSFFPENLFCNFFLALDLSKWKQKDIKNYAQWYNTRHMDNVTKKQIVLWADLVKIACSMIHLIGIPFLDTFQASVGTSQNKIFYGRENWRILTVY